MNGNGVCSKHVWNSHNETHHFGLLTYDDFEKSVGCFVQWKMLFYCDREREM